MTPRIGSGQVADAEETIFLLGSSGRWPRSKSGKMPEAFGTRGVLSMVRNNGVAARITFQCDFPRYIMARTRCSLRDKRARGQRVKSRGNRARAGWNFCNIACNVVSVRTVLFRGSLRGVPWSFGFHATLALIGQVWGSCGVSRISPGGKMGGTSLLDPSARPDCAGGSA